MVIKQRENNMKIISGGLFAEDGIHIRCERCECEYVIEDKSDFKLDVLLDKSIRYSAICPECQYKKYFGDSITERKDWEERFRIHDREEAKKYDATDYIEMFGYSFNIHIKE